MKPPFFLFFFFSARLLFAQQLVLEQTITQETISFFSTNHLGQIYSINQNEIQLYDAKGVKIASYSDPISGNIRFIDAFNPLQVLLFFDAFFTIQFLDNQLNPTQEVIRLDEYGFIDAQLASSVDQDQIWFYDQSLDRLIKWSVGNASETARTLTLSQLIKENTEPVKLLSRMDRVFLLIPEKGVLIFDQFGGFIKYVRLPKIADQLQIKNELLIFNEDNDLVKFNYKTLQEWRLPLPEGTEQFRLEGDRLYTLRNNKISIYKIINF
ncbi:MAG: hypothetical protein LAT76_06850 [Schleiferiaceae bacterium]|nr:hypothetical protein [Schleiferiaceae bacterium]